MSAFPVIRVNADATIRSQQVDGEDYCVVVDDFLQQPESIVEFALNHQDAFERQAHGYPGLLCDLPEAPTVDIARFIRSRLARPYAFYKGDFKSSTYLSMATLRPDELAPLQRLCHTDPRDHAGRRNYAALVYLFENEALGGTGFYRWKERDRIVEATAINTEDPTRTLDFLQQHFETFRQAPRYMADSNEIAELLLEIPPRFNRMLFYSGDLPHSAMLRDAELLTDDFAAGRLTLNLFASVLPR
jgi:hypothetical protein